MLAVVLFGNLFLLNITNTQYLKRILRQMVWGLKNLYLGLLDVIMRNVNNQEKLQKEEKIIKGILFVANIWLIIDIK